MNIVVLHQAKRELKKAPKKVLFDVYALFDDLAAGKKPSLPISRPLPSIAKGLHELRLSYSDGIYRVFYAIKIDGAIYILHGTKKKTQKIDKPTKELILKRLKELQK